MKELLMKFWKKDWTDEEKVLIVAMAASLGTIMGLATGFILSPAKHGLMMFSGNGCNNESTNKIRQAKKDSKKKEKQKKQ